MEKTATGAVALQTERDYLRPKRQPAAREREGSAARSIQQMIVRQAGPCREATMSPRYAKEQDARILRRENRDPNTWRHHAPSFSFGRKQLRAEFCSIATARAPAFALPIWNGTDTRFAPNRSSPPPPRTRNDLRSQTRNTLQSKRPRSACSFSSRTSNRSRAENLKLFLRNQGSARSLRKVYLLAGQHRGSDHLRSVRSGAVRPGLP
jgi:hypothetical protein